MGAQQHSIVKHLLVLILFTLQVYNNIKVCNGVSNLSFNYNPNEENIIIAKVTFKTDIATDEFNEEYTSHINKKISFSED